MTVVSVTPESLQAVSTSGNTTNNNNNASKKSKAKQQEEKPVKTFKCNTCLVSFEESKLHREHFKTDWHRINLKRKSKKQPVVSEDECVAILMLEEAEASDLLDYC
jgi:ribosome maturation protein SDO1